MTAVAALLARLRKALASVKDSNGLTLSTERAEELQVLLEAAEAEESAGLFKRLPRRA